MPEKYPPGPRGGPFGIMSIGPFQRDPLAFALDVARKYGDFAFVRLAWVRVYLLSRPELIREVLTTKMTSFHKLRRQMKELGKLEGESVNTADGASWRRRRPLVQSAFHARHLERFAGAFVEYTRRRVERWSPGTTFDMTEEMNLLALELIGKVLFDVDWSDRAARLREAVHIFRSQMQREISGYFSVPDWVPLPGRFRQRQAVREIDTMIRKLIRQHRSSPTAGGDILSLILAAARSFAPSPGVGQAALPVVNGPPSGPFTDTEIRDEAATLFVAGHDTTSAAMSWFWYLLARHPQVEQRVLHEVDTVLAGRPATFEDMRRLKYTEMTVKESMRLYPASGFLFGRQVVEDVELGGYTLRRGSWLFVSPYLVHHDPRHFKDPEVFDPERFAPGREDEIPPYTYMPFGGGPRTCIGNNFAMIQIVLVAATIVQKFRLVLEPGHPEVEPKLEVVLRPKGGIFMCAVPRERRPASESA